ncbi:MAG: TonB-dependent receptor plug domain-containing protein [Tannerella sp.]|jgi:TonB-dependent SusC/RagA subfamily outer membrane receptor|nr:TonB-dependent receptor plug domain-containing protein [Tannerella sp.]
MENFIFYLLKAGIWITVFWLIYRLFFRKEIFFRFNRFFLLAGLPASFALAFCQYHYPVQITLPLAVVSEMTAVQQPAQATGTVFGWAAILAGIYVLGALVLLAHHLIGLTKIHRLIKAQPSPSGTKPPVIEIPESRSAFSFFGYVFMDQTTPLSEVEKRLILEHETAHIEQRHWIDLLLIQIVCALQWFNPFVWLYRNAVKQNHEFLADRSVIQKGHSQAVYSAALINYTFKAPVFALTNSFAYNKLKRITMMKKNVSRPARKLAVLLLVPALVVFLGAFAQPEYQYSVPVQSEPEEMAVQDTIVICRDKEPEKVKAVGSGSMPSVKNDIKIIADEQVSDTVKVRHFDNDSFKAQTIGIIKGVKVHGVKPGEEPLYIVDGEEATSDFVSALNPADIYSISILKDASSAEQYGERGKNGVILLTTKRAANESVEKNDKPLYFIDGKIVKSLSNLKQEDIRDISVLKDESATKLYGKRGANGVILITTKKPTEKQEVKNSTSPLLFVDGKEYDYSYLEKIKPETIESVEVLKDNSATDKYGERGKNGVVIVVLK